MQESTEPPVSPSPDNKNPRVSQSRGEQLLAGRVVVVTGSGRGIGRAIARGLAARGAPVVLSSRTDEDLQTVRTEIEARGGSATCVVSDVYEPGGAERPIEVALTTHGRVDILVNNVGGGSGEPDAYEMDVSLF